jgi:peptidoglycan/LPS O-acetylase OafA/YrhL
MTAPLPAAAEDLRPARWRRAESPVLVWGGIGLTTAGFALIVVAWALLAGKDHLEDQLPPLVGVGLLGLGVLLAGLAGLGAAVLRRDGALRQRQLDQLTAAVAALAELGPEAGAG